MIVAIGIGIFIPKERANAFIDERIVDIQEYKANHTNYLITIYESHKIKIEMSVYENNITGSKSLPIEYPYKAFNYKVEYKFDTAVSFSHYLDNNSECIKTSLPNYINCPKEVCAVVELYPSDMELCDPTMVKIGDYTLNPVDFPIEQDNLPLLDIDDNGRVNILDAQLLLCYVLEVQIGNYESSWEGFIEFREDYWRETGGEI